MNMSKQIRVNRTNNSVEVEWLYFNEQNNWTGISRVMRSFPVPTWGDPVALGNEIMLLELKGERHALNGFKLNAMDQKVLAEFGF